RQEVHAAPPQRPPRFIRLLAHRIRVCSRFVASVLLPRERLPTMRLMQVTPFPGPMNPKPQPHASNLAATHQTSGDRTMKRYESAPPRALAALAAFAITVLTLSASILAPVTVDVGDHDVSVETLSAKQVVHVIVHM